MYLLHQSRLYTLSNIIVCSHIMNEALLCTRFLSFQAWPVQAEEFTIYESRRKMVQVF